VILCSWLISIILLLCCLCCLLFEASILNIGLDLSDEGWHLSKFRFPEEVKATLSRDHLYSSIIFKLFDYNLGFLRFVNLLFLISSSIILGYGFWVFYKKNFLQFAQSPNFLITVTCSIIICQLPSLWIERVPAYNNWAAFLSLTSIGFLFIWITKLEERYWVYPFSFGLVVCLAAFIRPPNSIALSVILILGLSSFKKLNIHSIIFFAFGAIIMLCIHFNFIESPLLYYETTKMGFKFDSYLQSEHGLITIKRHFWELYETLKFALLFNKYEILLTLLIYTYLTRIGKNTLAIYLIYLSTIYISIKHLQLGDINGAHSLYWYQWRYYFAQLCVLIIFGLASIIIKRGGNHFKWLTKKAAFGFLLLTSPVLLAFGTNNILMFNMNFYTSLFVLGIIICFCNFVKNRISNIRHLHVQFILLLFSLGPLFAYLNGRDNALMYTIAEASFGKHQENDQSLEIEGNAIQVTNSTKNIHTQLKKSLGDLNRKVKYMINFSSMPGLNFLCNLPHPIQSWTLMMKDNFTLKNISKDDFQDSVILINQNNSNTQKELTEYFPNWKSSHKLTGQASWSVNNIKSTLLIYSPSHYE